ncbi:MAG: hypothetical protein LBD21_00415 [Tannerellaceae bacterium]|jgi:hypothetical protein|nr:hypothetical protein [Tannerellaceae bacterium]
MKTRHSHRITAILIAGLLAASCTFDEVYLDSEPIVAQQAAAKLTYATISVALSDPISRSPAVSDEAESDSIFSIRILMYGKNSTGEWICESDVLAMNSGGKSATIEASSGQKRILVVANDYNRAWRFSNQVGRTLTELVSMKTTAGYRLSSSEVDFGSPALDGNSLTPMSTLNYASMAAPFVFSNSLADTSSLRELKPGVPFGVSIAGKNGDSDNNFRIFLKRSMAKVAASYKGTFYPVPTEDGNGTLTDLYWGILNQNRAVAIFEIPGPGGKPVAPFFSELNNWGQTTIGKAESYQAFWWNNQSATEEINIPLTSSGKPSKYYYVPENANETPLPGNITCIAVKATYTPTGNSIITSFKHNNMFRHVTEATRGQIETGATFYRLTLTGDEDVAEQFAIRSNDIIQNKDLFATREEALRMAYIVENYGYDDGFNPTLYQPKNFVVETYLNGVCYYRMDIKNGTKTWVERNKAYHGGILSFRAVGDASVTSANLSLPNESIYLGGTIEVIPWEDIYFEGEL